jgi:HD-GYP domain-containing protein (c-di-GMP phosphodiesterase class II)
MTATAMGLTTQEIETIYHGALLHDIGKIGIEDYLLEKLGILNSKEMDIVKTHPVIGSKIVKPLAFFKDIEPLILHHHERYDGSGYPSGLKKAEIPLGARIIGVCDAFETMLSGRTHLGRKTFDQAVCALQRGVGLKFDPAVVKAFFEMLQDHPETIDRQGAVERCKALLCHDIDAISLDNRLRKELDTHFMGCF